MIDALQDPKFQAVTAWIREHDAQTIARQIELTEIPAPPFGEATRGLRMADLFRSVGLADVGIDEIGNVSGSWNPDAAPADPLIVSAHLDTVFPAGTDVAVREEGRRIIGPGISDDGRGLAVMLTVAEALVEQDLRTEAPVLFVATVGEEGHGDLRGVKHLFREGAPARGARGFISIDGAGLERVVSRGLGSSRFRVTVCGRGGHSWTDFGTPNPIHALAAAVRAWNEIALPPKTTLTVARWGGGTAINAIPRGAWVEVDLRSAAADHLRGVREDIEARLRECTDAASEHADEHHRLDVVIDPIGERPPGATDPHCRLVRVAAEATRAVGGEPEYVAASTDANVAMSLGIPAVTLGGGGTAGLAHTLDEWYCNEGGTDGVIRALLTVLGAAGPSEGEG